MSDFDDKRDIETLRRVMTALRTPVTGCPWDLEQTFESIAPYTIEEAYEVADAIERDDRTDLKDELGDLLLQVIYHARMAEEEGSFAFPDVVEAITEKMIRRHPHVFARDHVSDANAMRGRWEEIKAEERAAKAAAKRAANGGVDPVVSTSVLDDVPIALPALRRGFKLQKKAARVGFDWPTIAEVLSKVREEVDEVEDALAGNDAAHIEEEIGDLLFAVTNFARHANVDAEQALTAANRKFTSRFHFVEKRLNESGRTPEDATLDEMDALWDEAKGSSGS